MLNAVSDFWMEIEKTYEWAKAVSFSNDKIFFIEEIFRPQFDLL